MNEYLNKENMSDDIGDIPDDIWYGEGEYDRNVERYGDGTPFQEGDDKEYIKSLSFHDQQGLEWYHQKNEFMRSCPELREISTTDFLHLLFCRDDDEMLPFEEQWCEAYDWWARHPRSAKRPPEHPYVYNGIAQAIYGKRKREADQKNKTFVITNKIEQLNEIMQHPFVIMSPVSYTGKRRTKSNARYLYAIAIDIDRVEAKHVDNLLYQSDPTRTVPLTFPRPQIIVNSGSGIHIYFLLETPHPMFNDVYPILNKVKKELTRRVWNIGTTHEDPKHPQFQGNCQGFRLPGTQTKTRQKVTAFQSINPAGKPFYKITDLMANGGGFLSDEEQQLLAKGQYNPNRIPLKQARELYPEWYERRIIQGHKSGRWFVKRDLYDWWKRQISEKASVGHRYFCLMALAVYAAKCNIDEDEFMKDLESFVEPFDGISYTKDEEDRFTIEDAHDAAAAYRECYCTFPLEDLRDITGIEIERNKTRKFRKRKEHLFRASLVRDGLYTDWTIGKGRKRKQEEIFEWRKNNPDGSKYACAKELGISKPTVMKWWDTTEENLKEERKKWNQLMKKKSKAQSIEPEIKSGVVEGYELHESESSELHDIGAGYNRGYLADRKAADLVMQNTDGYDQQSAETIRKTGDDLADLINFSEVSIDEIMRTMGIPEPMIPILKEQMREAMKTPEFWQQYKAANPTVDISKWPKEIQERFNKKMKDN